MLVDTDVLVWALRGNAKAARAIDRLRERRLSAVSYMELVRGARDKNELRFIRQYLRDLGFAVLPVTEAVTHRAVVYMEEFALSAGLDLADALIGATAAEHGLELCTGNARHYQVLLDLKIAVFKP